MKMKVKEAIEMAEENGWRLDRIRGDHRVFVKDGARRPLVISGHLADQVKPGTLSSIMRTVRGE